MSRLHTRLGARAFAAVLGAALLAGGPWARAADHSQHYTPPAATELKPFGRQPATPAEAYTEREPPLWDNLGTLTYRITTASPQAQKYFDQGLRLAYAFNHAEARRAFRQAQRLDPACALCYWGEALVLGPNINAPMEASAVQPAVAALARARAHAARVSPKEQALIEALAARYSNDPTTERAALDAAYAAAMGEVTARYPDDLDIAVLYAESLMDLSPWNYWEAGGSQPRGKTAELVETLERVLARDPAHPGAIHLYIHTVEASDRPGRAEPYADRLGKLMPGAGHVVHMPSHIYYRVGRYLDSLAANKTAVAADEAYIAQVDPTGIYPQAYYPHNVHFVLVSARMAGDGKTAIEAATKLERTVSEEAAKSIAWVQPIKAAPLFAHVQFSDPATALALPDPGDALPYVKAMWHYARGVAQAARGDLTAAQREADAIAEIARTADFTGLVSGGVPATDVLEIAHRVVLARTAHSRGDLPGGVRELQAAVAVQDRLPYTEPPFWYYPVSQSLGALLLLSGRADEAEAAFRKSLAQTPNNGWAIYGLRETLKARGDQRAADEAAARLDQAWAGDRSLLRVPRL